VSELGLPVEACPCDILDRRLGVLELDVGAVECSPVAKQEVPTDYVDDCAQQSNAWMTSSYLSSKPLPPQILHVGLQPRQTQCKERLSLVFSPITAVDIGARGVNELRARIAQSSR
jgi:hypothetical protein